MKKKIIFISSLCLIVVSIICLSGCSGLFAGLSELKGSLIGREFTISTYDNYGNLKLQTTGTKVDIGLFEGETDKSDIDGEEVSGDFKSEVLDITINGNQMLSVGETLLFEEDGIDIITDYELPNQIETRRGGGLIPIDSFVNKIKNFVGKKKLVIVSSEFGTPIGVYQGDKVNVTVPEDLPKMTRLWIDGKSVYVHRVDYTIVDMDMFK